MQQKLQKSVNRCADGKQTENYQIRGGKVMEREATTPKKNVYIVPDDGDRLMQPNEVCARLGTDNKFLKKLIILKLLKPVYFGKYARVAKTELNRFIEVHKGDDICRIVAIEEKKLKENKNEALP